MVQFGDAVASRKENVTAVGLGYMAAVGTIPPVKVGGINEDRKVAEISGYAGGVNPEMFSVQPVGVEPGATAIRLPAI